MPRTTTHGALAGRDHGSKGTLAYMGMDCGLLMGIAWQGEGGLGLESGWFPGRFLHCGVVCTLSVQADNQLTRLTGIRLG